jgi:methanogenic corrinoid protein MtbC1
MNQYVARGDWWRNQSLRKLTLMASSMFSNHQSASNDAVSSSFTDYSSDCKNSIYAIIESDIIPRLLSSQSFDPQKLGSSASTRDIPSQAEVEEFTALCTMDDDHLAQQFVDRLIAEGLSKEDVFLELITPSARYMGVQWERDLMDFYELTHGLARLHTLTHRVGFSYQEGPQVQGDVRRIMVASAPGSQHMLGPTIVSEFFRKEGWQVVMEISPTARGLVQSVSNEWFDVVGLSISIEAQIKELAFLIAQIKKLSRNRNVVIMLGGPIFTLQNFKAAEFGASGICTDAREAVSMALELMDSH